MCTLCCVIHNIICALFNFLPEIVRCQNKENSCAVIYVVCTADGRKYEMLPISNTAAELS